MTLIRSTLRFARVALAVCLPFWLSAAVGCGNDDGGGDGGTSGSASGSTSSGASGSGTSGAMTASAGKGGGGSAMGGSSSDGGKSGSAGTSAGASGKGSGGSGGGKAGGANVEPGEPCTANCPTGMVQTCFDDCPLGACDNGQLFADEKCSTYYPEAISDETIFCAKNQTATYCLTVIDRDIWYYTVSCAAGTPTVTKCSGGCGVDSDHVASCNG